MSENPNNNKIYIKVQNAIKSAQVQKYFKEHEELSQEGLSFWGSFNGKNNLQIEKLKNLKLKIELLQTTKIEEKESTAKEMLADLYASAIADLTGKFTPEMSNLYNEIKLNCKDENQGELEEEVYKLALEKIENSKNYLPIVHKEKSFGIFGNTKSQIEFLKLENKNIENQIIINRGNKFETEFK